MWCVLAQWLACPCLLARGRDLCTFFPRPFLLVNSSGWLRLDRSTLLMGAAAVLGCRNERRVGLRERERERGGGGGVVFRKAPTHLGRTLLCQGKLGQSP